MNRARPSPGFLAGAYWRHREGLPQDFEGADPARDGCRLLWLPPVLPFTGEAVREVLDIRSSRPVKDLHLLDQRHTWHTNASGP